MNKVCLLVGLLWLISLHADEAAWRTRIQEGTSAIQRDDLAAAKSAIDAALREADSLGPRDARPIRTLVAFGDVYRDRKHYSEAIPLYQRALELGERSFGSAHPDVLAALTGLAAAFKEQGRYADAELLYRRLVYELEFEPADPKLAGSIYRGLIAAINGTHNIEAETESPEKATFSETQLSEFRRHAKALFPPAATTGENAGGVHVYERWGPRGISTVPDEFEKSEDASEIISLGEPLFRDLALRKAPLSHDDQVRLFKLCSAYFVRRAYDKYFSCAAIVDLHIGQFGEEVIGIFHTMHPYWPMLPSVKLMQAQLLMETGQFKRAMEAADLAGLYFVRSMKVIKTTHARIPPISANRFPSFIREFRTTEALVQHLNGNSQRSLEIAKALEASEGNSFLNARGRRAARNAALMKIYLATGRSEDADRILRVEEGDSSGASVAEDMAGAAALAAVAFLFKGRGSPDLSQSAQAVKAALTPAQTNATRFQTAHIKIQVGRYQDAKASISALLVDNEVKDMAGLYWAVLYDAGRIAEQEGKLDDAVQYYQASIEEIERIRGAIHTEGNRIGFFADKQDVYRALVRLLFRLRRYEEAFQTTERSKARALVDMLASKNDFRVAGSEVDHVRSVLSANRGVELEALADDGGAAAVRRSAGDATLHLRARVDESAQTVKGLSPELASLVTVGQVSIKEIKGALPAETELVSYYYDGTSLYAFLIDRQEVKAYSLNRERLEEDVSDFRRIVRSPRDATAAARKLYDRLIAPLRESIHATTLVIAPHGVLHYIPFAALHDGHNYLSERYVLSVLPSASTIKYFPRTDRAAKPGNILAFGSPDLGDRSFDLKYAEEEAKQIAQLFPDSLALVGREATKEKLKELGRGFRFIHFATHGEFNSSRPLASALLLAVHGENLGQGRLSVGDLYSMDLGAELVTLSACNTGLGKLSNGDDMVGLLRGFMYAGASGIVATLWEVDDKSTELLMVNFYNGLRQGKDRAIALRDAQRSVRAAGYQHPYYWAAFQLTGAPVAP